MKTSAGRRPTVDRPHLPRTSRHAKRPGMGCCGGPRTWFPITAASPFTRATGFRSRFTSTRRTPRARKTSSPRAAYTRVRRSPSTSGSRRRTTLSWSERSAPCRSIPPFLAPRAPCSGRPWRPRHRATSRHGSQRSSAGEARGAVESNGSWRSLVGPSFPRIRRRAPAWVALDGTVPLADLVVHVNARKGSAGFDVVDDCPALSPPKLDGDWFPEGGASAWVEAVTAGLFAGNPSPAEKHVRLRSAGVRLFQASPKPFQEAYWGLVDQETPPRSLKVISDDPIVPWELMVPSRSARTRVAWPSASRAPWPDGSTIYLTQRWRSPSTTVQW